MFSGSSQPKEQPAGWAGRMLPKPARRSQGRLPGGGAPCERNRGWVGKKTTTLPGKEATLSGAWGGEGLSLAVAQGRAPQGGPGEGSPCLSHTKECDFTLKVMQKTKASHSGQGVIHVCFLDGLPWLQSGENRLNTNAWGGPAAQLVVMAQQILVCLKGRVTASVQNH